MLPHMRCLALALLIAFAPIATALEADNLLLLTNKNEPEGRKLAEYYTAQRKIPQNRIVARGERLVAGLVGIASLQQHRMQALLAIAEHWTPEQKREAEGLRDELAKTRAKYEAMLAHRADPKVRAELRQFVKEQFGLFEQ